MYGATKWPRQVSTRALAIAECNLHFLLVFPYCSNENKSLSLIIKKKRLKKREETESCHTIIHIKSWVFFKCMNPLIPLQRIFKGNNIGVKTNRNIHYSIIQAKNGKQTKCSTTVWLSQLGHWYLLEYLYSNVDY